MAGTSFTRQSTFSDGDTITAALFNNEFNQLVTAFSYASSGTTGHQHDGGAGEGGNIHTIGDQDFLNKIVVDSTNNRWGLFVEVGGSAVEQVRFQDGAFLPVTDSDVDLGTSSLYFKDAFIDSITTTGNVAVGGNLTVTGTTTFNGGTLTLGDSASDNVVFGADVNSSIIPNTDDAYDLGSSSQQWRNLFLDGTAEIDTLAINGTTVTSTAAELNILDGVTATATEINLLDGVTATTAELNILDGVTSTAAELNILDGVTATTAELNILDGVTSTATELNIVDGGTSATSTTLADADRVVVNDNGTMVQVALTDFETYFESALDTLSNVTTVGALNSGSITSGFGAINNGSSAITTTGTVTYGSLSDGSITITAFVDEDDMSSNSATLVPTQQSVKAYVDTQITAEDLDVTTDSGTIAIDLDSETLTISGGTGLDSSATGNAVTLAIDSTVATLTGSQTLTNKSLTAPTLTGTATVASLDISGDVDIDGTLETDALTINGTTLAETISDTVGAMVSSNTETGITVTYDDSDNTLDFVISDGAIASAKLENNITSAGTLTATGVLTANAGVVVDNITIDGTEIDLSSGDLTLDVAGDIFLNADGGQVYFQDGSTLHGSIDMTSGLILRNHVSDADVFIQGNDGGSTINALTLDMSDAGTATFNHDIKLGDDGQILFGSSFNGTIGTASGDLFIGTADANVLFFNSASILPANSVGGTRNDAIDIGSSSAKFKDAHFSQTVDAGALTVDNITIDGNEIDVSSGTLTLDVASDIIFDSDSGGFQFKDGGTEFGRILNSSTDLVIKSAVSDKDMLFRGNDGGSEITALTLDMSASGAATFNDQITLGGNLVHAGNFTIDVGGDITLDADGGDILFADGGTTIGFIGNSSSDLVLKSQVQDKDLLFKGNDGGSTITALQLDMSQAGRATFNEGIVLKSSSAGDFGVNINTASGDSMKLQVVDTGTSGGADGSITVSDGDFEVDASGDIILDADGAQIRLKDAGTEFGVFSHESPNLIIKPQVQDGDLVIKGDDGGSVITALTLDMSSAGVATFNSNIIAGGTIQANGNISTASDSGALRTGAGHDLKITYDGTDGEIDVNSGNLTLDVAGDITLNADGGDWKFSDGSDGILEIQNDGSGNAVIITPTSDKDMKFLGNDGGSTITALTFDMSNAGAATFNSSITTTGLGEFGALTVDDITLNGSSITDAGNLNITAGSDINLDADGGDIILKDGGTEFGRFSSTNSDFNIRTTTTDEDIVFKGSDGGSEITALTLDMSAAGDATFGGDVKLNFAKHLAIGTASPAASIDISGIAAGDQALLITSVRNDAISNGLARINITDSNAPFTGLQIDHAGTGSALEVNGKAVFNEGGVDADFRVESDSNTHMLFVDAGNNRVGIGEVSSPSATLHINSGANNEVIRLESTDTEAFIHLKDLTGSSYIKGRGDLRFEVGSADVVQMLSGETVVNNDSNDYDFRAESDGNTHMLFVDAGNNAVNIGTVTHLGEVLNVSGGAHLTSNVVFSRQSNDAGSTGLIMEKTRSTTVNGNTVVNSGDQLGFIGFKGNDGDQFVDGAFIIANVDGTPGNNDMPTSLSFHTTADGASSVTQRMIIDSQGFVGIGEPDPVAHVHVLGNNDSDGATLILQEANNNTADTLGTLFFGNNANDKLGRILCFTSGSNTTSTLRFMSTSDGGNSVNNLDVASSNVTFNENGADIDFRVESDNKTHALFLDAANDRVLVGRSAATSGQDFVSFDANPGTSGQLIQCGRDDASTKNHVIFTNPNGTVGSIQTASSATSYNTSSDARLKENIADADEAGELIDAIQVRKFDWKADGEHQRYGMVAQELQTVAPEAVSEGETEEDMMGVDYSKLVPMLVKELQTLRARVADLES